MDQLRRTDGQSPDGSALADRWRISVSDRLIPVGKSAVLGGRGGYRSDKANDSGPGLVVVVVKKLWGSDSSSYE